jgi:thiamine biosynthesis lipoprotein
VRGAIISLLRWLCLAFPVLLISCTAREKEAEPGLYSATRLQMGTFVTIKAPNHDPERLRRAVSAAFERIEKIEDRLSVYRPHSELSRLNRTAGSKPSRISGELAHLIERSLHYSKGSGGAFDVTVGPLIRLWKKASTRGQPPAAEEISSALRSTGFKKIRLRMDPTEIRFLAPDLSIDLGGIAKGYAVDEAALILRKKGIENALVEAGGDIYALGGRDGTRPWRVGIRDPFGGKECIEVLLLRDKAVTTSGDYERAIVLKGKRYSHIIDPRTGRPAKGVSSVTVIAPSALEADALSTAISVLGVKEGLALAETLPAVEVLIVEGAPGNSAIHMSRGFRKYIADE